MTPLSTEDEIARVIDRDAFSDEHEELAVAACISTKDKNETRAGYELARVDARIKAKRILALLPAARAGEDVQREAFEVIRTVLNGNLQDRMAYRIMMALFDASLLRAPEAPGWPKELIEGLRKQVVGCERQPSQDKLTETHLMWMLAQIEQGFVTGTKAHRWFAFVQGVLAERGLLNVGQERDRTRPFFQAMLSSAPSQQSEGREETVECKCRGWSALGMGGRNGPCPDCGGDGRVSVPAPSVERGVSEIVERLARALLEWEWGHDPVWEETQPAAKANYRDRAHWLIKKMRLPVADARNEGIEEALKKIKSYVLIENPDNFPEDTEIMASEIWAIIRPLFPELKSPPAEGKAK
jgi:hypothetical protein